jgi:alpha-ribazole phosphatase
MDLWLIRHPRPAVAPDICYGQLDLPLADGALAAILDRLPALPTTTRLRSSPARRCRSLADALHAVPLLDPRLLERNFGHWEGQRWEAIDRDAIDAWAADPWDFAPPGGESTSQLVSRVAAALDEETSLGGQAVWITHQGVIRAAAGRLLALAEQEWMRLNLDYGDAWCFSSGRAGWRQHSRG